MTGRNHTTNAMAGVTEITDGYPNANGHIPFECANIAEVLSQRGWNTYHLGKWHLTAEDEMNLASSKRQWPLGRGFERSYGFLGGETNQWYPDLVYDNHPVAPPKTPQEGYHLTIDLVDKAIEFIQDGQAIAPDKPFFMYFCPGAGHAPHHIFREWADRYRGQFDMGYEAIRETILARQKAMGILPGSTELSPINPYAGETGPEGQDWPEIDSVRPWDSLSADERRLFARMAEVYAGFMSHADHEIERLLDYLEMTGQLDNTIVIVVSDNGASGEGGPNGSVNENKFFNGLPDSIEENLQHLEDLGSTRTYNHYPTGWAWAFNTPFKMWKRYGNLRGGTADPMIISWPAGIRARGEIRRQYCHAVDIVPTLYEALGVALPEVVNGCTQKPFAHRGPAGRSRHDHDPAREIRARWRGPYRRPFGSRTRHRRLPWSAAVGIHRRHHQARRDRCQRAAFRRPGQGGRSCLRPPVSGSPESTGRRIHPAHYWWFPAAVEHRRLAVIFRHAPAPEAAGPGRSHC
jgi:arylsulfatase A-like enzyme